MAILRKTLTALLPFALAACETDFYPTVDTKPALCLNSLITAGKPIEVSVTHTWLYTDEYGADHHTVDDAEVRIIANGEPVGSDYRPKEGDLIRIEATSPTYGHAEAEVEVPVANPPSEVRYDCSVLSMQMERYPHWGLRGWMTLDISVMMEMQSTDTGHRYYRLEYKPFYYGEPDADDPEDPDETEQWTSRLPHQVFSKGDFISNDPIFSEYVSEMEEIMGYGGLYASPFFSDAGFKGSGREIYFQLEGCEYSVTGLDSYADIIDCGYELTVYSISESYFNWAIYFWQWSDGIIGELGDIGLAEPIGGYSNVSTGAGVVAAQSSATFTINIKDFLRKTLEERNP